MAAQFKNQEDVLELFVIEEAASSSLDEFLNRILTRCAHWFEARGASIFLGSPNSADFVLSTQIGELANIPVGTALTVGQGIAGKSIQEGRPKLVNGVDSSREESNISSSMIVPLKDSHGRSVGVLNLARGINQSPFSSRDLKLAESVANQVALAVSNVQLFSEIRVLSETLKAVLANVGFGVLTVDAELKVNHFNPEIVMILGALPAVGESLHDLFDRNHNEINPLLLEAFEGAISRRRYRARHTVGPRVWNVTANRLPSGGATLALQDVTDLEFAQREHERLKRLAEVGQMTATIAHEIRNPLTGIRSAAKMIRDEPDLSNEFSEIIEDESTKLSQLCDEFLEFARPLGVELELVDLGQLVRQVVDRMGSDFTHYQISPKITIDPKQPPIQLDKRRMEQVVRNLCLNSLQATKPGGEVTITLRNNTLSIADNGAGMDRDTVARLFSPFFTTKSKGTGLGLTTVRKIVEAHRAQIDVWSSPGEGTRFDIRFNKESLS